MLDEPEESRTLLETDACPAAARRLDGSSWSMEAFDVIEVLAESAKSTIALCSCAKSGLDMVLKIFIKAQMDATDYQQVVQEIQMHSQLCHPYIIGLYAAFEDSEGIYLVLEYAPNGNLATMVDRGGGYLPEDQAVKVLRPMFEAVAYMHKKGIMHRDLKPENVLLGLDDSPRLADFGLAVDVGAAQPKACVGTVEYMAPEVVASHQGDERKAYGLTADIWAAGIVVYETLVGGSPFEAETKEQTFAAILAGQPWLPPHLSAPARDLLAEMLASVAQERPTAQDILHHAWMAQPKHIPIGGAV